MSFTPAMSGIYKITNKKNGKAYIGMSNNIHMRWKKHCFAGKKPSYIGSVIKEEGVENFTFEILELCQPCDLGERERHYIREHNTFEDGYNQATGGGFGKPYSADAFEEWLYENWRELYKQYKDEVEADAEHEEWIIEEMARIKYIGKEIS